ncbi:MAG: ATPase [Bacteroidetes bacterium]|nr:ATPase [Bacteroidota bacterium]MBS1630582.1 ATPase [Bacteroidota bacterium]
MAAKKKIIYTLEFPIRSSPTILFGFLSTAVGLQEWFAEKVDQREDRFYFTWNGAVDEAIQTEIFDNNYVRYRWDYYDDDEFFEFRIEQSPVTNETILRITDYAEKADLTSSQQLWNQQIQNLKHRIGAA